MLQFLPISRYLSPPLFPVITSRDIDISSLDILLQFPDQRSWKNRFRIHVFHAGSLLIRFFRKAKPTCLSATIITPCSSRSLMALHGAVLRHVSSISLLFLFLDIILYHPFKDLSMGFSQLAVCVPAVFPILEIVIVTSE